MMIETMREAKRDEIIWAEEAVLLYLAPVREALRHMRILPSLLRSSISLFVSLGLVFIVVTSLMTALGLILGVVVVAVGGIFAFVVLLSLPPSRIRSLLLLCAGWGMVGGGATYVISPIDFVPDVIPLVGWLDDLGGIALALIGTILILQNRRRP